MTAKIINVAAAAIINDQAQVLLALRPAHLHQGNKWEFPGGKLEANETPEEALKRELKEELDIDAKSIEPLIELTHQYPEKTVRLHVFIVKDFDGLPKGKEDQELRWVGKRELTSYQFPDANYPIVTAVNLPRFNMITPELAFFGGSIEKLFDNVARQREIRDFILQLRLHSCTDVEYCHHVEFLLPKLERLQIDVMLNRAPSIIRRYPKVGWHVNRSNVEDAQRVLLEGIRPERISVNCHSIEEWQCMKSLNPDFALVSPVRGTSSHPHHAALGWETFAQLSHLVNRPCYALGGLSDAELSTSIQQGGQGVGGISMFLP